MPFPPDGYWGNGDEGLWACRSSGPCKEAVEPNVHLEMMLSATSIVTVTSRLERRGQ
ncbi:MAG: hypothetical protein WCV92_00080 [Candidatus Buchananbacteria bacterium]